MPAAIEYTTDQASPEHRALEEAYAKEHDARLAAIDRRWRYYQGIMPAPLRIESDGVNDNVLLPKVAEIADKIRSFLLGDGVQFDTDPTTEERGDLDEALDAIWLANRGKRLQSHLALSGVLAGHCWVQVVPQEGKLPRLINVDPRHASAFWDVGDVERVLWYRLQYSAGAQRRRVDYVRQSAIDRSAADDVWQQFVYTMPAHATRWQEAQPTEQLEFLPLVDWQNSGLPFGYYGQDDVSPALALNDSINLIASDYARILKHHSSPRTIGIGMDAADVVGSSVSGFYTVNKPKTEADIFNLEMQSDLKSAYDYLLFLIREAWHSGRMVDPDTVRDTIGTLTNFGLRVMMHDALAKTADKRELYSEGLERVNKAALVAAGLTPPEHIATTWPDVLPEDPAETQVLMQEQAAGIISRQTYRERRGYDQEQEEQRIEEEKAGEDDLGTRLLSAFEKGQ